MTTSSIAQLEADLAAAQAKSHAAMDRRRALPAGSSRARVTTANANWARAAEHRDRCSDRLDLARAAATPAAGEAPATSARTSYRVGATVLLGRSSYTIERVTETGLDLRGKRGGESALVQCLKQPALWGHVQGAERSTDYRQLADGTFEIW